MKVRDMIKLLRSDGWYIVRITGGHRQLHHPTKAGTVTVPGQMNADLPKGTEASIRRQAGM